MSIWISRDEILALPITGTAFAGVKAAADGTVGSINLSDQDDIDDVRTYARALVAVRLGLAGPGAPYRDKVIASVMACLGTLGGRVLALSRNLPAVVFAAELVGLPPDKEAIFRPWLDKVRTKDLDGDTLVSIHKRRPNNWGTQGGFALAAAHAYLGDTAGLAECARVFKGWLGDRSSYSGFGYGDLAWQSDPSKPVGINPPGAQIQGHNVDGGLPEELRRAGGFVWPPPKENYVYTALEGAIGQGALLARNGFPEVLGASQKALLRAYQWLLREAHYPAEGNDRWQPFLVNHLYGAGTIPTVAPPAQVGKSIGYTDWTHAKPAAPPVPVPIEALFTFTLKNTPPAPTWEASAPGSTVNGFGTSKNAAMQDWLTKNQGQPA